MNPSLPIRQECPPGACTCQREQVLGDPQADWRPLRLTREEEKRLIARLEAIASLDDMRHMQDRMREQLGLDIHIAPSPHGVRTVRGILIEVAERPGLCRKIRQSIPAAIRRAMEQRPEIAYALLDAEGLFGL
ncbi:MAG: hypothetical protein AB7E55_17705 [Pigmentiphaga sp.]